MRPATLILAMLGLLSVGATLAVGQERLANVPAAPNVTAAADEAVVMPVRWYVYRPAPGWYSDHSYAPYYTYRPRYYWYGPPRYYYADPYSGYYYPNGFGFEYNGSRRSFSFGF
jgi:hypothetical protein